MLAFWVLANTFPLRSREYRKPHFVRFSSVVLGLCLDQHVVVLASVDFRLELAGIVAFDGNAHRSAGADDFLGGVFRVVGEQVWVFLLGNLFDLIDREVSDEILLRFATASVEVSLVFDEFCRRWDTDVNRERPVVLVVDGNRHFSAVERFGLVVNLLYNRLNVDGRRTELGTEWRARVGLPTRVAGPETVTAAIARSSASITG